MRRWPRWGREATGFRRAGRRRGAGPRVLVIRCGAVGDTVLATCVLDPILARWPDARIEWLATPASAALFGADPRIARIHRLRHRKLPIPLSPTKRQLVRESRADPFALVLNLETADYFRRLAHTVAAKRVVGFGDGAVWQHRHGVENHRAVLTVAGFAAAAAAAVPRLVGAAAPAGLPPRFVALHPGNSHSGATRANIRAWPAPRWVELNRRLVAAGVATVITGAPNEADNRDYLVKRGFGRYTPRPADLTALIETYAIDEKLYLASLEPFSGVTDRNGAADIADYVVPRLN